jgi:hypothetical protein
MLSFVLAWGLLLGGGIVSPARAKWQFCAAPQVMFVVASDTILQAGVVDPLGKMLPTCGS